MNCQTCACAPRARHAWRKFTEIYGNPRTCATRMLCIYCAPPIDTVLVHDPSRIRLLHCTYSSTRVSIHCLSPHTETILQHILHHACRHILLHVRPQVVAFRHKGRQPSRTLGLQYHSMETWGSVVPSRFCKRFSVTTSSDGPNTLPNHALIPGRSRSTLYDNTAVQKIGKPNKSKYVLVTVSMENLFVL